MAAHPQQQDQVPAGGETVTVDNPFPRQIVVPGPGGELVEVKLDVAGGVVYAPGIDEMDLAPPVRQYVTQYCDAWTMSAAATGVVDTRWPGPPRRAQVVLAESQLHLMLGLAADERLVRIVVDELENRVRFVVESPRLPVPPYWDGGPPIIRLPIAANYEPVPSGDAGAGVAAA